MGITAKNIVSSETLNKSVPASKLDKNKLSKEELELLLTLIKRSQFLGEHVELIYNMTLKIQNQFLEENK